MSLLKEPPSAAAVKAMEEASTAKEVAKVGGRAVHLLYHGSSYGTDAKLTNVQVEKLLGVATNRNLTRGQCAGGEVVLTISVTRGRSRTERDSSVSSAIAM